METHIQEKFLSIAKDQMAGKPEESWAKGIELNGTHTRAFKICTRKQDEI